MSQRGHLRRSVDHLMLFTLQNTLTLFYTDKQLSDKFTTY